MANSDKNIYMKSYRLCCQVNFYVKPPKYIFETILSTDNGRVRNKSMDIYFAIFPGFISGLAGTVIFFLIYSVSRLGEVQK
jgi:hypothetical protein